MSGETIQDIQALQDLKVLDLTRVVAGPYAGSILGDFGASVLKIEVPGRGDDARGYGPYENGESMYYANLNRNKKGITLNLKTDAGKEIFLKLVRDADVLLENYRPGVMDKLGLGYEVFINFTSAGYNTIEQNIRFAQFARDKGVHAIEFADTESVMTEDYVKNTIRECHKIGIEMGVHLHDKNGTAENLADLAIAEGADYMDVTHVGLGGKWRDGNVTMEYLLRKLGISGGYEATMIRNEMIEELIQFHSYSAAE